MVEFVVVVESRADAEIATVLAERLLIEKVDWLEQELLQYVFQWSGLQENTPYSCWTDINKIIKNAKESGMRLPKFIGHSKQKNIKADGASSIKILNFIRILQKNRPIKAVFLIRDLDNQPERREGMKQARSEHTERLPQLEIIIGTANRMREAWVLNGFIPLDEEEGKTLENIKSQLNFDPCIESHRLRSNSFEEPNRIRNPKVVLETLTRNDRLREQKCWEETSLELLQQRGNQTGLTAYLQEVELHIVPLI
ncbi:MAG: hypothetical protein SAJ12_15230 [Jaaginema sp. PMC 1079.18]|nr:hypothetical protein [Jaaginema sp. PMC 1080.18]MEC4852337.1 hypothetical protein [Jaaginema sp. PMC 1079.18]MEC4868949.1 hypothetical protein [Jaaginema sp. PMC 1078.18]